MFDCLLVLLEIFFMISPFSCALCVLCAWFGVGLSKNGKIVQYVSVSVSKNEQTLTISELFRCFHSPRKNSSFHLCCANFCHLGLAGIFYHLLNRSWQTKSMSLSPW